MKTHLLPAGFEEGPDGHYVRRHQDQIHVIHFQTSKYGGEFTINLGFHYAFIPAPYLPGVIQARNLPHTHCVMRARIGEHLPEARDVWFPFGDDAGKFRQTLQEAAKKPMEVLDHCAEEWRNPATLLTWSSEVPDAPERAHVENMRPLVKRTCISMGPHRKWFGDFGPLAFACIYLRDGNLGQAAGELDQWMSLMAKAPGQEPLVVLQQLIKTARETGKSIEMPDWFV